VHLFAARSQAAQNDIVIAHELLHTFGATDKYDAGSDAPRYPEGFAEPQREPRYPQRYAEIMAGRVPLGPSVSPSRISPKTRRVKRSAGRRNAQGPNCLHKQAGATAASVSLGQSRPLLVTRSGLNA